MNQKDLFIIAVTIFLTIAAWVIMDIHNIALDTPTDADVAAVTLDYTIDTKILDILEKRVP